MDTEKYRALLCAIEKGSLSAAGEALGYTPSGISRMMASLEEEVGLSFLTVAETEQYLQKSAGVCCRA